MNQHPAQYISPDQRQSLQEQRMQRFAQMGIKPTEGVNINATGINGTFHNPALNRAFGDILSGKKRNVYKEMFGGDNSAPEKKENLEKLPGVNNSGTEIFGMMERMLDPDKGATMQMRSNGDFEKISADGIGPDFNVELQRRLAQRANMTEEDLLQQGTYHERMQRRQQGPQVRNSNFGKQSPGLSYSQFAADKESFAPPIPEYAEASSDQRQNYNANQSYMYQMNEGIIREIAQDIAEETIKSVLKEHIKAERDKYAFERVLFNKNGKKIELLKQGDNYYRLKTVKTNQGNFTALEEVNVRKKKRKIA